MAPTPNEWNALLAPGIEAKPAFGTVAKYAREYLDAARELDLPPIATNGLVEALYNGALVRGPNGIAARKRIYKALSTLAKGDLRGYAHPGEPVERFFAGRKRLCRPVMWQAPKPIQVGDIIEHNGARWQCVAVL